MKKDTIDSLKYDYRNLYTGLYDCKVDFLGIFPDSIFYDTLNVLKHNKFRDLIIFNIDHTLDDYVHFDF